MVGWSTRAAMRTPPKATWRWSLIAFLLLSSCASMKSSLAQRATFDLGCAVKEENITEIVSGQYGVTACGCKATYLSYPTWTLNVVSGDTCKVTAPSKEAP